MLFGCAIYANASGVIKDSSFINCFANEDGGAVLINADGCSIENCEFNRCRSYVDGGAILIKGKDCSINNCKFDDCTADDDGALYVCNNIYNTTVNNCEFNNCFADDKGDVLSCHRGDENVTFDNCIFMGHCECISLISRVCDILHYKTHYNYNG